MVEKYIELRLFTEYILPFIILGFILLVAVVLWIMIKIADKWEERQKKLADKHFGDGESEG